MVVAKHNCEAEDRQQVMLNRSLRIICVTILASSTWTFPAGAADSLPEVKGSDYRVSVGPPGPRVKDDAPLSQQELAAMEYEKSGRKRSRDASWSLQATTLGVAEVASEIADAVGGKANVNFRDPENRPALVTYGGKPSSTRSTEILEFPSDTLRRRQLDNWDRMGQLPGFSYLDNIPSDDAFQFEGGTGPYPDCKSYTAFEREKGLCPPLGSEGTGYLLTLPDDLAGQR